MPAVKATDLSKRFKGAKHDAVDALNFSVQSGAITGLLGPDGAGKTTLLRLMAGLLRPSGGVLEVLGRPMPDNSSELLQNIGYMPQKFGLYEDLSVLENLTLYARLQSVDTPGERIERLLHFTSLDPFQDRTAKALSGGMKQKLGLACALIKKPKLLLLDEPGVGVDPISRKELWKMVEALVDEQVAVVWSTSYLEEADRCQEVLLLSGGKALYRGSPQKAKANLEERVYTLSGDFDNRRDALEKVLAQEAMLDATLRGEQLRLLLRPGKTLPKKLLPELGGNISCHGTKPEFEDAFMNILDKKPPPRSVLSDLITPQSPIDTEVISARGLTKRFGDFTATDKVDFHISQGEIFGFLGPNGAGKSTTFKMLCGLLVPTKGSARVLGEDLYSSGAQVRGNIGYMAQKFSLYGNLSVRDNLEFFSGVYGLKGKRRKQRIEQMVETFELQEYLHSPAETLPLGLKQRLALACSVMHEPKVLFLDEPTSGVDPLTRKEFWTHINAMVKKGISIMVTTHFMEEAEYCDKIMLIYKGKAIATGSPERLKKQAKNATSMEEAFIDLIKDYDREHSHEH